MDFVSLFRDLLLKCQNLILKLKGLYCSQLLHDSFSNNRCLYPCQNSGEFEYYMQYTQPALTCSKLTVESLEQGVKCVQS